MLTLRPEIFSFSASVVAFCKSVFLCNSGARVVCSPLEQDVFGTGNTGCSCLARTFSFSEHIAGLEWERVSHCNFSGFL